MNSYEFENGQNLNTMGDTAEFMCKKYGARVVFDEVENILSLERMAREDKASYIQYTEAVKAATKENFIPNVFANEEHRRRAEKYISMIKFAAREAARHNAFVYKHTGNYVLSRRYDLSKVSECKELLKEFRVYATQVGVEAYIKIAK